MKPTEAFCEIDARGKIVCLSIDLPRISHPMTGADKIISVMVVDREEFFNMREEIARLREDNFKHEGFINSVMSQRGIHPDYTQSNQADVEALKTTVGTSGYIRALSILDDNDLLVEFACAAFSSVYADSLVWTSEENRVQKLAFSAFEVASAMLAEFKKRTEAK